MSQYKIYARTAAGDAELEKAKGRIAGDDKRVMLLIDGKSSEDDIGKKIPPSVHKRIDEIFARLLAEDFIVAIGTVIAEPQVKRSGRIPAKKVKEAMMISMKFNKDMLVLAEIEIERRMELEQDLGEARTKLAEANEQIDSLLKKYSALREQVVLYRQSVETKIAEQQAQLAELSGNRQASQTEKIRLEHELEAMRGNFKMMQTGLQQKTGNFDATAQMMQRSRAEVGSGQQGMLDDNERAKLHPHFQEVRCLDFFKKLSNADLVQLLEWAEWQEVKAGQSVVEEGQTDITFYVVVSGKLGVVKGKKTLNILHAGEPFGEIAYLSGDEPKRSASIIARTDCTLLAFNPAYLDDAGLTIRVIIAEAFMAVQAKRLKTTVDMVGHLLVDDNI